MIYDLAVIGGGSAGLTVAAAAAQFGRKVALFEMAKMGGECLNTGCVPSKALIAAARRAHEMRSSGKFGIACAEPEVDFAKVNDYVQSVIAAIEPHDSQERFENLGVDVIRHRARFLDGGSIEANGKVYRAKRFVIATGSRAAVPPIAGLNDVPYLTNETLFSNRVLPKHLIVIGGGPQGLETAQAHRRLGSRVTVIEAMEPLAKEDPELAQFALQTLRDEGVEVLSRTAVQAVRKKAKGIAVKTDGGMTIEGSHILVAAGREPNVEGLNLEAAGVAFTRNGITVDKGLKTTNRRIYAIGDAAGGPQFTHAATHHAELVIRNALFGLPVNAAAAIIPRVTFTDPEIAQAGLTEAEARARHGEAITVLRWPFRDIDRAEAEGRTTGLAKAVTGRGGHILGIGIAGPQAGEILQPWLLAMANGLKIKALATMVTPYPTFGEINRRIGVSHFSGLASNPWVRRVIETISAFRR